MNNLVKKILGELSIKSDEVAKSVEEIIKTKADVSFKNMLLLSSEGKQLIECIVKTMKCYGVNELDSFENAHITGNVTKVFLNIECESEQRRSEILSLGNTFFQFLRQELGCNVITFQRDTSVSALLDNTIDITVIFLPEFDKR